MPTSVRRWGNALTAGLVTLLVAVVAQAADSDVLPTEQALFRQGAALWPETCADCHKARPGGESSPAEWDIITLHMRVVANLTANDTRAIQTYLRAH